MKVFISRLLFFVSGIVMMALFQNCGKKFESAALIEFNSIAPTEIPGEVPEESPEPNSKIINCTTPVVRYERLDQTCLPLALEKIAKTGALDNFFEHDPKYPLYSDGAEKRRWVYLPPGTQVNTSNPDKWIYPKGTIVFKEFGIDGQVVETRMIEKMNDGEGFDSWRFSLFAAKVDGSPATRITQNILANAGDADAYIAGVVQARYKIGNPAQCIECHSGPRDVVQGFSYLQVSNQSDKIKLSDLLSRNLLSHPPMSEHEIQGGMTSSKAIGYIQSNCASCHHGGLGALAPGRFVYESDKSLYDQPILQFARLRSTMPDPRKFLVAGDPENSRVFSRMDAMEMPRIPLVQKDTLGVDTIREWVLQIDPSLLAPPLQNPNQ